MVMQKCGGRRTKLNHGGLLFTPFGGNTIVRILKIKGLSFSVVGLIHLDVRMKLKHLFELLLVLFRRVSELGNVDLKLSIPDH